jgi:hypothetical protein
VPVNYGLIIFVFPPAVVWYEENIIAKVTDDQGNVMVDSQGNEQYKKPNCICWAKCPCYMNKNQFGPDGKKLAKLGMVERIFDTHINNIVGHP